VLKQNGANVDEIVKQLVYNASVEFTAYYYFTNLRALHHTGRREPKGRHRGRAP
jgi:ferritin-like protein